MIARPVNLLVFREGRRDVRLRDLKAHLVDRAAPVRNAGVT